MTPTEEMIKYNNSSVVHPQERTTLTIREQAAIAAMKGIISNNRYNGSTDMVAKTAVKYADALIKELNLDKD